MGYLGRVVEAPCPPHMEVAGLNCCGGDQKQGQQAQENEQCAEHGHQNGGAGNRRMLNWVVGIGLVALVGYFLYQNGFSNILLYGLVLLCPLMHLFMGHGHGHGQGHQHGPQASRNARADNDQPATPRASVR